MASTSAPVALKTSSAGASHAGSPSMHRVVRCAATSSDSTTSNRPSKAKAKALVQVNGAADREAK